MGAPGFFSAAGDGAAGDGAEAAEAGAGAGAADSAFFNPSLRGILVVTPGSAVSAAGAGAGAGAGADAGAGAGAGAEEPVFVFAGVSNWIVGEESSTVGAEATGEDVTLLREIFAVIVGEALPAAGEEAAGGTGETVESVLGVSLMVGEEEVVPAAGPPGLAEGRSLMAGFAPCIPD